jgi:hypothetical protein
MIMDYYNQGSVSKFLNQKDSYFIGLSDEDVIKLKTKCIKDVIRLIIKCITKNIFCVDIKLENFIVDYTYGEIKTRMIDFDTYCGRLSMYFKDLHDSGPVNNNIIKYVCLRFDIGEKTLKDVIRETYQIDIITTKVLIEYVKTAYGIINIFFTELMIILSMFLLYYKYIKNYPIYAVPIYNVLCKLLEPEKIKNYKEIFISYLSDTEVNSVKGMLYYFFIVKTRTKWEECNGTNVNACITKLFTSLPSCHMESDGIGKIKKNRKTRSKKPLNKKICSKKRSRHTKTKCKK